MKSTQSSAWSALKINAIGLGATALLLFILYSIYSWLSPTNALSGADKLWDGDQRFEAIQQYKILLRKEKPGLHPPGTKWLDQTTDRGRLYRRIIEHEAEYGDPAEARDWIREAQAEGIYDLIFESQRVREMWNQDE